MKKWLERPQCISQTQIHHGSSMLHSVRLDGDRLQNVFFNERRHVIADARDLDSNKLGVFSAQKRARVHGHNEKGTRRRQSSGCVSAGGAQLDQALQRVRLGVNMRSDPRAVDERTTCRGSAAMLCLEKGAQNIRAHDPQTIFLETPIAAHHMPGGVSSVAVSPRHDAHVVCRNRHHMHCSHNALHQRAPFALRVGHFLPLRGR